MERNPRKILYFCRYQLNRMKSTIYNGLAEKKKQGKKSFAVLIDPDKVSLNNGTVITVVLDEIIELSVQAKVDYLCRW